MHLIGSFGGGVGGVGAVVPEEGVLELVDGGAGEGGDPGGVGGVFEVPGGESVVVSATWVEGEEVSVGEVAMECGGGGGGG